MKIKIDDKTVDVDIEKLAKVMAINAIDWPAWIGRAEKVAKELQRF